MTLFRNRSRRTVSVFTTRAQVPEQEMPVYIIRTGPTTSGTSNSLYGMGKARIPEHEKHRTTSYSATTMVLSIIILAIVLSLLSVVCVI